MIFSDSDESFLLKSQSDQKFVSFNDYFDFKPAFKKNRDESRLFS